MKLPKFNFGLPKLKWPRRKRPGTTEPRVPWWRPLLPFLKAAVVLLGILILLALVGLAYHDMVDYTPDFNLTKGVLIGDQPTNPEIRPGVVFYNLTLLNNNGLQVPCRISLPGADSGSGPWPAVVLVPNFNSGSKILEELPPQKKLIVIVLDYPAGMRLDTSTFNNCVISTLKLRAQYKEMVARTLMAGDYLAAQRLVRKKNVTLVGIGTGAYISHAAAAADNQIDFLHRNFANLTLIQAGADLRQIIATNAPNLHLPCDPSTAGWLGAWLLKPLDPRRYMDSIAPKTITIIGGKEDPTVPAATTQQLFDRASDPKQLIWLEGDSAAADEKAVRTALIDRVMAPLQPGLKPAATDKEKTTPAAAGTEKPATEPAATTPAVPPGLTPVTPPAAPSADGTAPAAPAAAEPAKPASAENTAPATPAPEKPAVEK